MKPKYQIIAIRGEMVIDESPDTSYLGEYSDQPAEWAIVRETGEFCHKVYQRQRLIADIQDRIDDYHDYDYYGKYLDSDSEYEKRLLIRLKNIRASGETSFPSRGREYVFFHPYASGEKPGTKEYRKYAMHDFQRMRSYCNGDWCFIGIVAKAQIRNNETHVVQTLHSCGLWGIESDSGDYLNEVAKEQLHSLKYELLALGIGERAIQYALKNKYDGEIHERN
jgi:hypothetical protein